MFGIIFSGHIQLGRILTDYSFMGHPLRRDYPLSGFSAVYYDNVEGRVMNEPVSFAQELRLNRGAAAARRSFFFENIRYLRKDLTYRSTYSIDITRYIALRR